MYNHNVKNVNILLIYIQFERTLQLKLSQNRRILIILLIQNLSIVIGGWFLGNVFGINHLLLMLIILLVHSLLFFSFKYHEDFLERGFLKESKITIFMGLIIFFSLKIIEAFIAPTNLFKLNVFFIVISYLVAIFMTNGLLRYIAWQLRQGYQPGNEKYIFTLSNSGNLEKLKMMFKNLDPSIKIIGNTVLDGKEITDELFVPEEQMVEFITCHVVDSVYIFLEDKCEDELNDYILLFEQFGVDVNIVYPPTQLETNGKKTFLIVDNYPVINCSTTNYNQWALVMSKLIDIMAALFGLLICIIVGVFIAFFIKLEDKGPILFVQDRIGRNGRVFKFYKFRSMRIDAEQQKDSLLTANQVKGNMFKIAGDPRITRVGNFIRKTSLDELPQFYNILRGDMSLVGTRPPLVSEYTGYTATQKRRLSFKLGLTGNWQVSGRNMIQDFDEVVELDVDYIKNWSIWLDIKIILKTFSTVLLRKGAL